MARPLDERQQRELTDFVNAIAEAAGYKTTAEWARESGYPAPNLSDLRNGKGGVDGYNLLKLVRAAAARADFTPEELAAEVARVTAAGDASPLIARRLEELSDLVTEALTLLRDAAPRRARAGSRTGRGKRAAS